MGDLLIFPEIKVKGFNLRLETITQTIIECESLERYLNSYKEIMEGIRREKPVKTFLKYTLDGKDWAKFVVRNVRLNSPYGKFQILNRDALRRWYMLSQRTSELLAFINLSEEGRADPNSKVSATYSSYGDVVSVLLYSPRVDKVRYAEIQALENHSLRGRI